MYIYSNIELNKNQIKNGVFHVLGAAPSNGVVGQFYYDSTIGAPRFSDGAGGWNLLATDSAKLNGQTAAYYLDRSHHTGTQTASTISDFEQTVKSYPLQTLGKPTANVDMAGFTLINLSQTPNGAGQAAEYQWVLNQISSAFQNGIKAVKDPVRVLIANNIAITGLPSSGAADGVTLAAGERVLLTGQSTGSQNGIWQVQTGAWTRPIDFDQSNDIETGTEVLVNEGATYGGSVWRITTTGTITLGTTAIAWSQVNKINVYSAGNGLTLNGMVFSVVAAAGGGLTVSGSGVAVDRSLVGFMFKQAIGDGSATSFTVTHNLGSQDVDVTVRDTASNEIVYPQVIATSNTQVTVNFFGIVPAANQFRVKVTA